MLRHGEINPYDVFGLRRLNHCPPHFEKITFSIRTHDKVITDWIYENLSGRFYIGDYFSFSEDTANQKKEMMKVVAFERHEEASYFGLFLPSINSHTVFDIF